MSIRVTTFAFKYATINIATDASTRPGFGGWVLTTLNSRDFNVLECVATREDTPQNRLEAEMEGYTPDANGVWQALVEHEILHSLLAQHLWDRESYVIRTESGAGIEPLWDRYLEEALVISVQRVANTFAANVTSLDLSLSPPDMTPRPLDMYLEAMGDRARKFDAIMKEFAAIRERLGF